MSQQEITVTVPTTADGVPYLECPDPVAKFTTGNLEFIEHWYIDVESGKWGFNDTFPISEETLIFSCPENVQ